MCWMGMGAGNQRQNIRQKWQYRDQRDAFTTFRLRRFFVVAPFNARSISPLQDQNPPHGPRLSFLPSPHAPVEPDISIVTVRPLRLILTELTPTCRRASPSCFSASSCAFLASLSLS